jgi:hypothetical protein
MLCRQFFSLLTSVDVQGGYLEREHGVSGVTLKVRWAV